MILKLEKIEEVIVYVLSVEKQVDHSKIWSIDSVHHSMSSLSLRMMRVAGEIRIAEVPLLNMSKDAYEPGC